MRPKAFSHGRRKPHTLRLVIVFLSTLIIFTWAFWCFGFIGVPFKEAELDIKVSVTPREAAELANALKKEKELWDRAGIQERILNSRFHGLETGSPEFNKSLRKQLHDIPQCRALGKPFLDYLQTYLMVHYFSEAALSERSPMKGMKQNSNNEQLSQPSRLIYSCESHKKKHFCGGMGDRFRGIFTSFWLALLSRRRFEVYHPTPVPIQKYMPPYLVNYIPSWESSTDRADMNSPKSYRESLSPLISTASVNQQLMRLRGHKTYVQWQRKANEYVHSKPEPNSPGWWRPQYAVRDIRIQSNSPGIDDYLSMDTELTEIKSEILDLADCNISCYAGCLSHILFQPNDHLWNAALRIIQSAKDNVLLKHVDGLQQPPAGLVLPMVGLQLRMGGKMAENLRVPESVRTFPWALPHYYALVEEVVNGTAWREHPEFFPKDYVLRESFSSPRDAQHSVTLFITSDSHKAVQGAVEALKAYQDTVRVIENAQDPHIHTDTMNLDDFNNRGKARSFIQENKDDDAYFNTLLSHYMLSLSSHLIISQSGFSDTAFWRSRQVASAIIVDVTPQLAWQHHLRYEDPVPRFNRRENVEQTTSSGLGLNAANHTRSAKSLHSRIIRNLQSSPTPFYGK